MPYTEEEIDNIRADCFANDVWYDAATLADLSEEDIIEFFESGGETLPDGVVMPPKPKVKPKPKPKSTQKVFFDQPAEVEPLPPIEERGARRLICLHAAAACGEIMRRQCKQLQLEACCKEVQYIEGTLPVDAALHPDAKTLRAFYPTCANVQYMEGREVHGGTREDRLISLTRTRPDDRALWEILRDEREEKGPWKPYFRHVEPPLQELARVLATGGTPADETGLVGFAQGATLAMMFVALLDAADDADAERRRERLMPSCLVRPTSLIGPSGPVPPHRLCVPSHRLCALPPPLRPLAASARPPTASACHACRCSSVPPKTGCPNSPPTTL
jgi:hypothetical protein